MCSAKFDAPEFGACKLCGGQLLMVKVREWRTHFPAGQLAAVCLQCDVVKERSQSTSGAKE